MQPKRRSERDPRFRQPVAARQGLDTLGAERAQLAPRRPQPKAAVAYGLHSYAYDPDAASIGLHAAASAEVGAGDQADDVAARVEGKSSLGRLGLLTHATAGFVDAGWDGHLTLGETPA